MNCVPLDFFMQLNKIIIGTIDLFKALKTEKYTGLGLGGEFEPSNRAGSSSYRTFFSFLSFFEIGNGVEVGVLRNWIWDKIGI